MKKAQAINCVISELNDAQEAGILRDWSRGVLQTSQKCDTMKIRLQFSESTQAENVTDFCRALRSTAAQAQIVLLFTLV